MNLVFEHARKGTADNSPIVIEDDVDPAEAAKRLAAERRVDTMERELARLKRLLAQRDKPSL